MSFKLLVRKESINFWYLMKDQLTIFSKLTRPSKYVLFPSCVNVMSEIIHKLKLSILLTSIVPFF